MYLHEITNLLEKLLQKELQEDGISLSIQEIICLSQSAQMTEKSIDVLSEKSIYTYQHLLFNLNKLEKKNLIDLRANPKVQKELLITFTTKGEEVIKILDVKQKKLLLEAIPKGLDDFRKELYIKLKI